MEKHLWNTHPNFAADVHFLGCPNHFVRSVMDPKTVKIMEYQHLIKTHQRAIWLGSFDNKIGRISKGVVTRMTSGTKTIVFIPCDKVSKRRMVTYRNIVVSILPQKDENHRTRLTVGGNLINYPGNVSTPTYVTSTAKMLFNSTVYTPGAQFMCVDVKDFYLNIPMESYKYMWLPTDLIPEEIIDQYNLRPLVNNGRVYMDIKKSMYSLP